MYKIPKLPLEELEQIETRKVLRRAAEAHRYLAELKGLAATIPNEAILINTLSLQEAKDSSEIENIITTHDEIYKASLFSQTHSSPAAKEVQDYSAALKQAFYKVREQKLIRLDDILGVQRQLEKNEAGLRRLPGTNLKNLETGEIVYTPPQSFEDVEKFSYELIDYINDESLCSADPLVKMAIIHHQFESIHPFYDGNGRTGRILNILYLVAKDLLNLPILYLSRFIVRDKKRYYEELQNVRDKDAWEPWLTYMLEGITETSQNTINLITQIRSLMQEYKHEMRDKLPKIYRQELLNNLFNHPYTKIDFVIRDLGVSRLTATRYLEQLTNFGFVHKEKVGRSNYYINEPLFKLLLEYA